MRAGSSEPDDANDGRGFSWLGTDRSIRLCVLHRGVVRLSPFTVPVAFPILLGVSQVIYAQHIWTVQRSSDHDDDVSVLTHSATG